MNTKDRWNPHMNKDSVAFSALLITGLIMAWFAAATSMTDPDAALTRYGASASASDSRSVVTTPRLKAVAPSPSSAPTVKIL